MFNHISQIAIPCTMINQQYTSKESIEILLNNLNSTNPHTKIVLISSESLQKTDFKQAIKSLANRKLLAFIAIDEMHAIAESSHEYRGDYQKLDTLKEFQVPILGLTATATLQTLDTVTQVLTIENANIFKAPAWRSNLVVNIITKKNKEKISDGIARKIDEEYSGECGIIYCLHQTDVMDISSRLTHKDPPLPVSVYFGAGLDPQSRSTALNNWLLGNTYILIATKSAGTGINKPNVRFVFQIRWPESVEEYFQQTGRAGRDNLMSHCTLFPQATNRSFRLKHLVKNEDESFRNFGVKSSTR